MSNLIFSAYQLIVDENNPSIIDFQEYVEEQYNTKDNIFKITTQKVDNKYYWLYAVFGAPLPYSEEVYDKEKSEIVSNPRTQNQAELNKQLFCLYDFKYNTFYISNSKKKTFLEEYFKYKLEKDIVIKRFFKSKEDFVNHIKTIDSISFTSIDNLFSINNDFFGEPKDIFGLGQPENFKMEINYNNRKITNVFKDKFLNLLDKKDKSEIHSLVCIGKDENKIEAIFDIESFTQTIPLNLKKDEFGQYDENVVQSNLLNELIRDKNV